MSCGFHGSTGVAFITTERGAGEGSSMRRARSALMSKAAPASRRPVPTFVWLASGLSGWSTGPRQWGVILGPGKRFTFQLSREYGSWLWSPQCPLLANSGLFSVSLFFTQSGHWQPISRGTGPCWPSDVKETYSSGFAKRGTR